MSEPNTDDVADRDLQIAEHFADIARLLLVPGTVPAALERIVLLATATIDSCDEAGLCGGLDGRTTGVVRRLEEIQELHGEGPCEVVRRNSAAVYVPDLATDSTWPSFSPAAVDLGMRSVLAFPLSRTDPTLGALQLYSELPDAFGAGDRAQGLIFASYAGIALTHAQTHADDVRRIDDLATALLSRETIGQAQGILMERERITADAAFRLLRRASQNLNIKLRDVAQEIVDTGSLPS